MGYRRLGMNELCKGQQEKQAAGSSPELTSPDEARAGSWQWSHSCSSCVKPGLQNGEEEEKGRVKGKKSAYGV